MWGSEVGSSSATSRLATVLRRAAKPLLVIVAAALLAGCGSDEEGTIPADDADTLISLLNAVEEAVADQNCEFAEDYASQFVDAVNQLPAEVDDEVKEGLREAGQQMTDLSQDPEQCDPDAGASGEEGPEEEPTSTTTTSEEPETTTTTTTTEEEQTDPSNEGQGPPDQSGGNPGGGNEGAGGGNQGGGPPEIEVQPGTDSGGIMGKPTNKKIGCNAVSIMRFSTLTSEIYQSKLVPSTWLPLSNPCSMCPARMLRMPRPT